MREKVSVRERAHVPCASKCGRASEYVIWNLAVEENLSLSCSAEPVLCDASVAIESTTKSTRPLRPAAPSSDST